MLRKCTKQEYEKYKDFAYEIAMDPTKAGYPSYSDGVKTKEMFFEREEKAFERDYEGILLFEYEGNVEGWINYYALEADNYLGTSSFNINSYTEVALKEFIEYSEINYSGYDLFLGYSRKNKQAVNYLETHGFECIEESINNTFILDDYKIIEKDTNVIRVTKDNYDCFRAIHDQIEGDMYWNSDRIYNDFDNWIVFVKLNNGESVGCAYIRTDEDGWYEIYGIDMKDNILDAEVMEELFVASFNISKEKGAKFLTCFTGKEEQESIEKLGFACADEYVCYKKHIG